MKIRKAAFAGRFYPANKKELIKLYEQILLSEKNKINYELAKQKIIGAIVPHAGFIYSGYQAIHFFEILKKHPTQIDTIIIVNPNHTAYGEEISLDENFAWESTLGVTVLDHEFMQKLDFPKAEMAHRFEHSGEVMLPFLQYVLDYDFKILPISMSVQNYSNARLIAESIFNANKKLNKEILIIASSDFSHFISVDQGHKQDSPVIDFIQKFESKNIENEVQKNNLSICGYGPIMSLIEYAKLLSPEIKNKTLRRGHSGEVNSAAEVVHYLSMLFYKGVSCHKE
jgi:AmmeMemoRadiSam system protein B